MASDQGDLVRPFVERRGHRGAPSTVDRRQVVNALPEQNRTGCEWRLIPRDVPSWNTVRYYFDQWTLDGTLIRISDALRRHTREGAGRDPEPSAGIVDSLRVRTTDAGGERGICGARLP